MRIAAVCALAGVAHAQDATVDRRGDGTDKSDDLDLELTMSTFVFRETGEASAPIVDQGAPVQTASPVRRYFGDLRMQLSDAGLSFDGRVRQTSSERYQSGADGGGEYEIRTLAYRVGGGATKLVLGRQYVDAVGETKIDGAAFVQRLSQTWSGTLFGGAYPALGSRSLDTDYPAVRNPDGTTGAPLVPIVGGAGVTYTTPDVHGDVGVAAVHAIQDVRNATTADASRVFTTASGYARPAAWLDVYHFALVDVAGGAGVNLTNGSIGVTTHPTTAVQLSAAFHHVSTDLLQIAARNTLADPDPGATGIVQNDVAIIRVSQDDARAGASVALARRRFEISVSGGVHRRPGIAVELADGSGTVTFPEARSADATLAVLDRKSIGGVRASATATLTYPLGKDVPNRSRGAVVRVAATRAFADGRAEIAADVMAARFHSITDMTACSDSLNVLGCFSSSTTSALQAGGLGSYRIAREWLFLVDAHAGVQDIDATTLAGAMTYPRVLSVTVFARAQWRYR